MMVRVCRDAPKGLGPTARPWESRVMGTIREPRHELAELLAKREVSDELSAIVDSVLADAGHDRVYDRHSNNDEASEEN